MRPPGAPAESSPSVRPGSRFVRRIVFLLALGIVVAALWAARTVVLVIFAGCLIAILLDSVASLLTRAVKLPRRGGVLAGFVLLLLLLAGTLTLFGNQVAAQVNELTSLLPDAIDRLRETLRPLGLAGWVPSFEVGAGTDAADSSGMSEQIGRVVAGGYVLLEGGANALALGLVALFTGLFVALDPAAYREGFLRLFPERRRNRLRDVLHEVTGGLALWLRAQFVLMAFVGLICGFGLYLLGVPLAPLLGLIAFLFEFVPIVGPIAAAVPAVLVGFTVDAWTALYVVILYLVVNQVEGLLLMPVLQQRALDLPAAATLVGVVLFGTLLGFLGIVLAMPLLLALTVTVRMLYIEDILEGGDSAWT